MKPKPKTCPTCGARGYHVSKIDLVEARRMLADGYTYQEIATRFGVRAPTAYRVLNAERKGKG